MVRFADDGGEEADERLAPVTPLFGPRGSGADTTRMAASAAADELPPDRAGGWDRTWTSDLGLSREADETEVVGHADADEARDAAEKQLLRKLRSKPLSIAEARAFLAKRQDFGGNVAVVGSTSIRAPCSPGRVRALAQVAARRKLKERRDQRAR